VFRQTGKWIGYVIGWLVLMLVPLIFLWVTSNGGGTSSKNSFTITSFDATYQVSRHGDGAAVQVTERITADFGSYSTNHGIERYLDTRYGQSRIDYSNIRITDEAGKTRQYSTYSGSNGQIILRIGDPDSYVDDTETYVISYRIDSAMVATPEGGQEIYLDTNGTGWQVPISSLHVTLTVDADLAGQLTGASACYQGTAGATDRCTLARSGSRFTTTVTSLSKRENVTIAVGFAPGTVQDTIPAVTRGLGVPPMLAVAVLPGIGVVLLAAVLIVRGVRRRTAHANRAVVTQYQPPKDLEPMVAADLLNRPETGAAAQLARLVVSGMAELITKDGPADATDRAQDRRRLGRKTATTVRNTTRVRLTDKLDTMKDRVVRDVCRTLWGHGKGSHQNAPVGLASASGFAVAETTATRIDSLVRLGLRKPAAGAGYLLGLGFAALVIAGWVVMVNGFGNVLIFLGAGVVAVLLLVAAVYYCPPVGRLTPEGRQTREHLLGLQDFVTLAEGDRIRWLQNAEDAPRITGDGERSETLIKLYEPLLPYAIIFGVEQTWTQVLGELYENFPAPPEMPRMPTSDLTTLATWSTFTDLNQDRYYYWHRDNSALSFWDSRAALGQGPVATGIGDMFDSWAASRDDDSGGSGGWFSGGGSSGSSWSSSSSGSSGGGFSGGGAGGGGGGGW